MHPLITSRLTSLAVDVLLLALINFWMLGGLRASARHAMLRCRCRYSIEGLVSQVCPECGRDASIPNVLAACVSRARTQSRILAAFISGFQVWGCLQMLLLLLEINRVVKFGDAAFLPGYSRFARWDNTDAMAALGISVVCILLVILTLRCTTAFAIECERVLCEKVASLSSAS